MNDLTERGEPASDSPIGKFREKVAERIRDDIGTLMPDEMLQQIVKETIQAELDRPVKVGGFYNAEQTPWIRKEILGIIKPSIEAAVSSEIKKHEVSISKMVKDEIKELIPAMFAEVIMAILKGEASSIEYAVRNLLNRGGNY